MKRKKSIHRPLRFSRATPISCLQTVKGLFVAVRTVIWTPKHDDRVLHRGVSDGLLDTPIELDADVEAVLAKISKIANSSDTTYTTITAKERMGLFAVLMQFTMYIPNLAAYFRANYNDVQKLYKNVTTRKDRVSSADVLELALEIKPNLVEAMWLALVTTRQYARWYDKEALANFPSSLTKDEATSLMTKWYLSVKALKPYYKGSHQDSAGDLYYVFTHATAKVVFGPMSHKWAIDAWFYKGAVHIGTWLNHSIAHKVSPQSINSNHTIAARYGNAIGKAIVTALKTQPSSPFGKD